MATSSISFIPLWLALLSLVFAVFVGMVAGFFPALRAMRLSLKLVIENFLIRFAGFRRWLSRNRLVLEDPL